MSDADDADAADGNFRAGVRKRGRPSNRVHGPSWPNCGSRRIRPTRFAGEAPPPGSRHCRSPSSSYAPANALEPRRPSERAPAAGVVPRDLDPHLACMPGPQSAERRVASGQCHTAPPITTNGVRGKQERPRGSPDQPSEAENKQPTRGRVIAFRPTFRLVREDANQRRETP